MPEKFHDRRFYQHNPTVTLMRTTPEENDKLGKEIAEKASAREGTDGRARAAARRLRDRPRGPAVLVARGRPGPVPELRNWMSPHVELIELDLHINDPDFALTMAKRVSRNGGGEAMTRDAILARLREQVANGRPIVGAGAGHRAQAPRSAAEAGGADLLIIYNSGRYRMAGHGSLAGLMPYGDANTIVMDMGAEVLPVVKQSPVLAGVCGTDPFRLMPCSSARSSRRGSAAFRTSPRSG